MAGDRVRHDASAGAEAAKGWRSGKVGGDRARHQPRPKPMPSNAVSEKPESVAMVSMSTRWMGDLSSSGRWLEVM